LSRERVQRTLRLGCHAAGVDRERDRQTANDPEAHTLRGETGTAQVAEPGTAGGRACLPMGVASEIA